MLSIFSKEHAFTVVKTRLVCKLCEIAVMLREVGSTYLK
jgi:hypothetical protein